MSTIPHRTRIRASRIRPTPTTRTITTAPRSTIQGPKGFMSRRTSTMATRRITRCRIIMPPLTTPTRS